MREKSGLAGIQDPGELVPRLSGGWAGTAIIVPLGEAVLQVFLLRAGEKQEFRI